MKKKILIILITLPLYVLAQNEGDNFFGSDQVHTINITFSQPNFWDSLVAYYSIDKFMSGNVEIDGTMLTNSGVQLKGNSSYSSYPGNKKSMNLDFNEYVSGQDIDGLNKLNLNNGFKDPTMMREKVFLDFCQKAGIPAPRCTYAKVYINGTYWGLYTAVEQVNKDFCGTRFVDNDGNLFKGDPHGTLQWKGPADSLYYADYELKTNETENDWSDLVHLINIISNSGVSLADSLNTILDVDEYMNSWAVSSIFVNLDSYVGSGHNYYIYDDSVDFKFHWITWDVNEAFGNFNQGMDLTQIKALDIFYVPNPQQSRPLNYQILQNTTLKQQYVDAVCNLASNYFTEDYLYPLIDSLADKIRTDLYADTLKMFTNQNFEDNIENDIVVSGMPGGGNIAGLKSFVTDRRSSLETQLATWGCYLGLSEDPSTGPEIFIYPNPASDVVHFLVEGINTSEDLKYSLTDLLGQTCIQGTANNNYGELNCSSLQNGIYFLNINGNLFSKIQIIH